MSLQTRLVSNLYRRARSCSEAGYPASLQHLYLHKKILPLQIVQSCYRKLCIVVTEIGALLLPKSEHSRLPKSVHFPLPFTPSSTNQVRLEPTLYNLELVGPNSNILCSNQYGIYRMLTFSQLLSNMILTGHMSYSAFWRA